jgi:phospholipid/cholesterol/gamma-HCH transport system substrate-binding protein
VIEQIGFLGDQYVAVYPQSNAGAILKDGDEVPCEEPFNLQEIVRSTTGLIQRVNNTLKVLSDAFQRADRTVFSEQSLSNLTVAISNFRQVSDRTLNVMENVQRLVQTNTPSVSISVSNLARFSQDLDKLAAEIHATFASNRVELSSAVKNMESAARVLSGLAEDVEAGKGVAGSLFKDEALQAQLRETFANLATLSSNLTRYGLLYKPKQPKREAGSKGPVSLGRNPTK